MNLKPIVSLVGFSMVLLVLIEASEHVSNINNNNNNSSSNNSRGSSDTANNKLIAPAGQSSGRQLSTIFNRIRGEINTLTHHNQTSTPAAGLAGVGSPDLANSGSSSSNRKQSDDDKDGGGNDDDDNNKDKDDDDEDDNDDDDDDEADDAADDQESVSVLDPKDPEAKIVTDMFGNKLKLQGNRTILLSETSGRDFGLLTIKALLLAPLIGLTIKGALIKGFLWSVLMYALHLLVPGLLTTLGLGTGLVGFARQLRPDYAQLMLAHLSSLPQELQQTLPPSVRRLTAQYRQVFEPVIESIQSIPEGPCRFRAVCETASHLVRHTQFMSNSLQRLSATVYLNFGTEYSKAWLDGVVQSDCARKYALCPTSPISQIASKLAETVRPINLR